jgi:hypothetical protein
MSLSAPPSDALLAREDGITGRASFCHTQPIGTGGEKSGSTLSRPDGKSRFAIRADHAFVAYVVLVMTGLIVVRASVDAVGFLTLTWILILAGLPLLPWLLPRLGGFLKAISPYVQSVKLGALQLDLRTVQRDAITVPSSGTLANVPNDTGALSNGTKITELISALRELRRGGASPAAVIDLRDGHKWLLPNLYFLARLLELEPVVKQLVFTEIRGAEDGYLVGTCQPGDLRHGIERAVDGYATASANIPPLQTPIDFKDGVQTQLLGTAFVLLENALPPATVAGVVGVDPARGFVSGEMLRSGVLRGIVSSVAIEVETVSGNLSEQDARAVIEAPYRFVPATTGGRLANVIDRERVALAVARAVLAPGASRTGPDG